MHFRENYVSKVDYKIFCKITYQKAVRSFFKKYSNSNILQPQATRREKFTEIAWYVILLKHLQDHLDQNHLERLLKYTSQSRAPRKS